jgi:hypothetical protein
VKSVLDHCAGLNERRFEAGDSILAEGSVTGTLFVLIDGAIEVRKGDVAVATVREPGALFGEMAVLLGTPHTASVVAVEPLVRDVVHYVMKDESRHVAFGVISLRNYYTDMGDAERREREEFVIEACHLMRDRLVGDEIATHFGWPREEVRQKVLASPVMKMFRQSLFARVVPNIKKLGLLTPFVRKGFEDLEIIQFENYDAEAADRAIGLA